MSTTFSPSPPASPPQIPSPEHAAAPPTVDPYLARDLERLRAAEQARIDRERQAALARFQELARFD